MKRLLLVPLFLLFTLPAQAEVKINVATKEYGVIGTTKNSIMRSMQRNAPYKKGSSFVPAYTGTNISYKYVVRQQNGLCSVKDVTIFLNLTYMYPRLAQHQSTKIRWWWRDIIKAYKIHEEIHGDISIRWAHEMERRILGLKNLRCDSIKEVVETKAKYVYDLMRHDQEEYDHITKHGLQQYKYKGPQ